ncbi:IS3 family transposase [Flavobacterium sp. ZB4R12]|uniref:IS3 family transposase n=1 Tax=Flavobacterium sp. ZB4R12 TaxID=3398732 RepID=UPI003AAE320B
MKELRPNVGLSRLCWLFGITRQAYYQSFHREEFVEIEEELVLKEVITIRKNHPRIGTRKLYIMLEGFMLEHQIKIGRDALFDLLSEHQLLIRQRKRKVTTTQSHHWLKKYPNLIRDFIPTAPNQLYVSDITYWRIEIGFVYISFITDAYSHKIVGHNLAETLDAIESVSALRMALLCINKGIELIHHSDRGVQYCSGKYVTLLEKYNINISMTENGDPLENAIAERVNGILKGEYLECYIIDNFEQARELLDAVVKLYNEERPHMSIGNLTPEKVHTNELEKGEKKWKNYYQKKLETNLDLEIL